MRCRSSRRNNPEDHIFLLVHNRVRHQQQHHAFNPADCLPTLLAIDLSVLLGYIVRIVEHSGSRLKADVMLLYIALTLCNVPFKSQAPPIQVCIYKNI